MLLPTAGQPLQLNGSGAFDAAVHCAAMSAANRARKRLKRSAIARRLLAPFARSASCHATMGSGNGTGGGLGADAEAAAVYTLRTASSSSSLDSTALAGPDAHISVQPAAGSSGSDMELQDDEAASAQKGVASPPARWGLSPDCERLLWR